MRIRARHYATGESVDVVCDGGTILSISTPVAGGADHEAGWVAPALFDLQINGCDGHSFNTERLTADTVRHVVRVCRKHGIGGLYPTLVTNGFAALAHGMATIRRACEGDPEVAWAVPAIHLEGPYIAAEDGPRGAHPRQHVRPPDWDEFSRIREAVAAGARLSTHLGNGCHALLPRHDNYVWEQLATDQLWASIICDGHHLPPAVVRCLVRVKTPARTVLTCDASSLAGLPPGRYREWDQDFDVLPAGKIVVPGTSYLAGSGVFTDVCVGNVIRFADVSLRDAVDMAGARPRQLLGLAPRRLEAGDPADLVLFDWEPGGAFRVTGTVSGRDGAVEGATTS
jgi:N-acetylglucosamine-6-phosphate deacetylase